MKKLFKVLGVTISVFFSLNGVAENANTKILTAADFVHFTNAFTSIESIYTAYRGTGIITEEDRTKILSYLQSHGVDIKARVPKVVTVNDSYTVGQISLRRQSDGVYKTGSGSVIVIGAKESAFNIFRKTYEILQNEKEVSLWLKLLLPTAQAESTVKPGTNIATALGPMLLEALFIRDAGTIMAVIPNFVGGGIARAWNFLPEMIAHGKVECLGNEYVYTSGFSSKIKSYAEDMTPEGACKALRKEDANQLFAGRLCEFAYRSDIFFSKSVDRTANRFYVPKEKLKNYFTFGTLPSCNKKNAEIVQEGLKSDAKYAVNVANEKAKAFKSNSNSQSSATKAKDKVQDKVNSAN